MKRRLLAAGAALLLAPALAPRIEHDVYATAEKIDRQMFDNMLDAQKRIDALLTPQQRQQLGQAGQ